MPSIEALGDDDDASAPDKRRTLEQLLARGPVLVHVDARRAEVAVPPRFRADASLVLRFGYTLSPAIGDLAVDDDAISGTLTFAGQPFRCVLPWTAVYAAMVEGEQRGTVWPEDVPEDVLTGGGEPPAAAPPAPRAAAEGRRGPREARDPPQARRVTMARAGAGVVWMVGSIVALAACGGAKPTAPARRPGRRATPSPRRCAPRLRRRSRGRTAGFAPPGCRRSRAPARSPWSPCATTTAGAATRACASRCGTAPTS